MRDEDIIRRIRLNGRLVTIREPKESITFEEFIKGVGPIIEKMARVRRRRKLARAR